MLYRWDSWRNVYPCSFTSCRPEGSDFQGRTIVPPGQRPSQPRKLHKHKPMIKAHAKKTWIEDTADSRVLSCFSGLPHFHFKTVWLKGRMPLSGLRTRILSVTCTREKNVLWLVRNKWLIWLTCRSLTSLWAFSFSWKEVKKTFLSSPTQRASISAPVRATQIHMRGKSIFQ